MEFFLCRVRNVVLSFRYVLLLLLLISPSNRSPLREPPTNLHEVIPPRNPLLLSRQNPRRIHNTNIPQNRTRQLRPLQLIQKADPELLQPVVREIGGDGESVSGDDAFVGAVHYADEAVGCGFRANALAGEIAAYEVFYEGGFTGTGKFGVEVLEKGRSSCWNECGSVLC